MPVRLEVGYFNTVILVAGASTPGSGGPDSDLATGPWYVEESRIKGEFNGKSVDFGVQAHITDENYKTQYNENTLIYSGIYNKNTGTNETNQFIAGEDITRSVDPKHGSIQKLYAEDNDLNIFQERKVNRALIDKDAIYTATGSQLLATSRSVIGQINPYLGQFGISKFPESHAYNNGRQYFVDKEKGSILRLSRDGITEISQYGIKDFAKDVLKPADFVRGMFDEDNNEYIVCVGTRNDTDDIIVGTKTDSTTELEVQNKYATIGFKEDNNSFSSFYTYKPYFGFNYKNDFYTFNEIDLWKHQSTNVKRASFYGSLQNPAYIELVINDATDQVKNFLSLNYEGSTGWSAEEINCGFVENTGYEKKLEAAYLIPHEGILIDSEEGGKINAGFVKKENEFFAPIRAVENDFYNDATFGYNAGIKGHYINLKLKYWNPNEAVASSVKSNSEIFTVSIEASPSSK